MHAEIICWIESIVRSSITSTLCTYKAMQGAHSQEERDYLGTFYDRKNQQKCNNLKKYLMSLCN